jgi:hypothetical protein
MRYAAGAEYFTGVSVTSGVIHEFSYPCETPAPSR